MSNFKPGDRVAVNDKGLKMLRDLMAQQGLEVKPNHYGTVEEIWKDGELLVLFDDGQSAPYPERDVRHLEEVER